MLNFAIFMKIHKIRMVILGLRKFSGIRYKTSGMNSQGKCLKYDSETTEGCSCLFCISCTFRYLLVYINTFTADTMYSRCARIFVFVYVCLSGGLSVYLVICMSGFLTICMSA